MTWKSFRSLKGEDGRERGRGNGLGLVSMEAPFHFISFISFSKLKTKLSNHTTF